LSRKKTFKFTGGHWVYVERRCDYHDQWKREGWLYFGIETRASRNSAGTRVASRIFPPFIAESHSLSLRDVVVS
jgi:hypothetical protein